MIPKSLIRKEVRQLLPWTFLAAALEIGARLLTLLVSPPDQLVWADSTPIFHGGSASGRNFMLLISALVFAYSGFPREYDDNTLPFLLSLPISRTRLFLAKVLPAAGLLAVLVLGEEVMRWFTQLPNPGSFDGRTFRLTWALVSAVTGIAVAWIFLGYGLFLCIFRRFGLLLGLLALTTSGWIADQWPGLRRLSPFELQRLDFDGTRALVPWLAIFAHLAVASAFASVSALVWIGPLDRLSSLVSRAVARPIVKWIFGAAVVASIGWVGWSLASATDRAAADFGSLEELGSPEAKLSTRRYEFRYPSALQARVERLAQAADAIHDTIQGRLGAAESPRRILANLTESSPTHAGSATWETIRMDLFHASDDQSLLRTLAHETAHVIALRASDRRTQTHAAALRSFDEGLAELLALELVPDPKYLDARRFEAALMKTRFTLDFSDLTSFDKFEDRFGEAAVYPIALVWLGALVEVCGADAPRRILTTLARPDTPRDLAAEALWQHVFQAIRCEPAQVNTRWANTLKSLSKELEAELAAIPSIAGGAPMRGDEEIFLNAQVDGTPLPDAMYTAVFRTRAQNGRYHLLSSRSQPAPDGNLTFFVPEEYDPGGIVQYQFVVSWLRGGVLVTFCGEWQKTNLGL